MKTPPLQKEGVFFCLGRKNGGSCLPPKRNISCDFKYYQRFQKEYVVGVSCFVPDFTAFWKSVIAFCNLV